MWIAYLNELLIISIDTIFKSFAIFKFGRMKNELWLLQQFSCLIINSIEIFPLTKQFHSLFVDTRTSSKRIRFLHQIQFGNSPISNRFELKCHWIKKFWCWMDFKIVASSKSVVVPFWDISHMYNVTIFWKHIIGA